MTTDNAGGRVVSSRVRGPGTRHGNRAVRVLIADDNVGLRQALAELVDLEPSLELAGVAGSADEAVELAGEGVDVALVDVRMPGGGESATRRICDRSPRTRVIAFSAHGDRQAVVGMVGAGAVSYLLKGTSGTELVKAIHRAVDGGSDLSQEVVGPVVGELVEQLQHREREVLDREHKVDRVTRALRPGATRILFQPVVDLTSWQRLGVEALARFDVEPTQTPDVWFRDAWEVGLGLDLELAAVREAMPALDRLGRDEFLSLNLSPSVVTSPRFAETVPAGAHAKLVVEITEHAPVEDYTRLSTALGRARAAGLRLAIDDAGAGYASLRHILRLAPDIIKLDMSLTRNLHADKRRRALVAALVPFAREIGATVIAEGIETEEELTTLRAFGAQWGQGYLLGRPGAIDAAVSHQPRIGPA